MRYVDINAWLGSWPFRGLRDNTPETLIRRLDRAGIGTAAVSRIEAILHRSVQPANERLAEDLEGFTDRLIAMATINAADPNWEGDLRRCHEDLGMRGARLFPQYHDFAVDGPEARKVVAACTERGLPVFIPHRIEDVRQRHWMDPGRMVDLNGVANLIAAVSGATIVIPNARGIASSAVWQAKRNSRPGMVFRHVPGGSTLLLESKRKSDGRSVGLYRTGRSGPPGVWHARSVLLSLGREGPSARCCR